MATVAELIADQQATIAATLAQADAYLQSLVQQANVVLIEGTTILPEQYDYASVPQVDFPLVGATRPNISGLVLAAPPEAPSVSVSSIAPISLPTDDLVAPTGAFAFAEGVYASTLLDPLKAKLLDNLVNGGYGIEPTDEIALFNRARDREVEAMLSRVEDAGRAMAVRGFPLPPGELSIHADRAYQEMQDKVSSASRDITLQRGALFVENRKFTITEVRQLETVLLNYWNSVQERAYNVARATVEMSILVYNALLARYRARLEAAKITADVNIATAQVDEARARAAFEIFRSQVTAYEANLRRVLDPARLQVDIYRADADVARVVNDGTVARANLQQRVLEATIQQNIEISRMTIENARVRLLGVLESLKFRTGAAQYGSEKFFALLTSLESTINTLAVQTATD
jgi:hypothetical protein